MNIKIIKNELVIRIPIRKIEQTVRGSASLTGREAEVFGLMVRGMNAKDVARELNLSPRTGKFHICNIMKKYGCTNRTEFAATFRSYDGTI